MSKFLDGAAITGLIVIALFLLLVWIACIIENIKSREVGMPIVLAVIAIMSAIGGFARWYWF